MFDTTKRQATTNVEVFHESQKPNRPYKEIGELSQEYFTGEDGVVMQNLVGQARKHGADAIIMLPGRDAAYKFDPFGRSGNRYVWHAAMVVWTGIRLPNKFASAVLHSRYCGNLSRPLAGFPASIVGCTYELKLAFFVGVGILRPAFGTIHPLQGESANRAFGGAKVTRW